MVIVGLAIDTTICIDPTALEVYGRSAMMERPDISPCTATA